MVTNYKSKQFCLFAKSQDKFGAAAHAFKSPDGMVAQLGEGLRTEVWKFMVLPIPPDVFHRIAPVSVE